MKESGQKVAIKKMSLDEWYESDLLLEVVMMKANKHRNIVNYIDTYMDNTANSIWVTANLQHLCKKITLFALLMLPNVTLFLRSSFERL